MSQSAVGSKLQNPARNDIFFGVCVYFFISNYVIFITSNNTK